MESADTTAVEPTPVAAEEGTARRALLAGGVALAAGATGWARTVTRVANGSSRAFRLDGHNVHTVDGASGRRLALGDRLSGLGELLADGRKVGEFYTTSIFLGDPFGDNGAGRVEQHTFALHDGLLVGTGVVAHGGGPTTFAVIAGTGAYAGAKGSYVASIDPIEDGGEGVASFLFTIEGM